MLLFCCSDKPTIPVLTTSEVRNVTQTTAESGGNISDNGGREVTGRGISWSTSPNPTIASLSTSDGTGDGSFVSSISGLTAGNRYYVRAYATNSEGTAYGNEISFTTAAVLLPTLTTSDVVSITATSATSGGNILSDGGGAITARGICWSTSTDPDIEDYKTIETGGIGTFTSTLTALLPSTNYYIRAYATNNKGTGYGNQIVFRTNPGELLIKACYKAMTFPNPSGGRWIWGQNVSIGDTAYLNLAGNIDNYDIPWCASFGCCDNTAYNGMSISIHTIQADNRYRLQITGGLTGGSYFTDGYVKIPSGWVIDSTINTSNNPGTGAYLTVTGRNIVFHSGTEYSGCVCSDCGRANISFYIRKE